MRSKDRVRKAIRMGLPDRTPILLYNRDFDQSDLIVTDIVRNFSGANRDCSEWGFCWRKRDGTMGQPMEPLIGNWSDLDALSFPDAFDVHRFDNVSALMKQYSEQYHVASFGLSGFTIMTILRGFSPMLEDLMLDREHASQLADIVFSFEEAIIGQLKEYSFDAVAFFDDWGMQSGIFLSPRLWRDFFKPRYKRQFDMAHSCGLDVYFHSCGNIDEIIPDLIEIGVDILNLSQPNACDIESIGSRFAGKVCFLCPISYQTISLTGDKDAIYDEAERLQKNLGCKDGGFIGYVEEYHSIGLSDQNYTHCINAFRNTACGAAR
jgi:hypothetical protein